MSLQDLFYFILVPWQNFSGSAPKWVPRTSTGSIGTPLGNNTPIDFWGAPLDDGIFYPVLTFWGDTSHIEGDGVGHVLYQWNL